MVTNKILRAASGWLELGMPDDALEELQNLGADDTQDRKAMELTLAALMLKEDWNKASRIAAQLCELAVDEPDFFLHAAFCIHEAGDTGEAKNWLLRGPGVLQEMPVFHYNMACYLWTLGEKERARNHLSKAVEMDESFLEFAREDSDLAGMEI